VFLLENKPILTKKDIEAIEPVWGQVRKKSVDIFLKIMLGLLNGGYCGRLDVGMIRPNRLNRTKNLASFPICINAGFLGHADYRPRVFCFDKKVEPTILAW